MLPLLPDDVISEILSWLPVKPACRFRCVSKGWYALMSGPAFLAAHKTRSDPLLLSVTNSISSSSSENSSILRMVDMDGNILSVIEIPGLWTFNYDVVDGPLCFTHGIHVPSILPGINCVINMTDLATGNVMRTPEELNTSWFWNLSVGCAVPSRTYKAVCLMSKDVQEPCKVLTVEDGAKWRVVQYPPATTLATAGYNEGPLVTINGVMHFLYKFVTPQVDEDYVFRFDLESEEWKVAIKGPTRPGNKVENEAFTTRMVKLNDALCIVQQSSINIWLIWLLKDSAIGTWVRLYTVPMASTFDSLVPLTVMRDGRKLLFTVYNNSMKIYTLQVYDPLTGTCTYLMQFASNLLGHDGLRSLHLECFVAPNSAQLVRRVSIFA